MWNTMFRPAAVAMVTIISFSAWCRADGLIYQLPDDGSWVRFRVSMEPSNGDDGARPKLTGTFTMRSVGRETVEGNQCRWIELELIATGGEGQEQHHIVKLLLPEKNLQPGKQPLAQIVKGWHKNGDQEPEEYTDQNSEHGGPVPAFLSGPLKDVKELPKKTIDTKLGKLECAGITANNVFHQGSVATTVQFETRLNEKAPFGVVSSKIRFESTRTERVEKGLITFEFDDAGHDAKSSLPEKT